MLCFPWFSKMSLKVYGFKNIKYTLIIYKILVELKKIYDMSKKSIIYFLKTYTKNDIISS